MILRCYRYWLMKALRRQPYDADYNHPEYRRVLRVARINYPIRCRVYDDKVSPYEEVQEIFHSEVEAKRDLE